jgi:WD40 repeat protein
MLPEDGGRLPPSGRRLMVESRGPAGSVARVYDKVNLPDAVLEMLRLVRADAWAIFDFPQIQSDERWKKGHPPNTVSEPESFAEAYDRRLLAVSNDRKLAVVEHNPSGWWERTVHINSIGQKREPPFAQGEYSTLSIHERQSGAVLYEAREPADGRRWIYAYSARFTPDDQYLLVLTNLPAVQTYDTRSWRLLKQVAGLPAGAIAYYPSSDWKWGVAVLPSGEISLWDKEQRRSLARIDRGGELERVAFSTDDSRVAVVTLDQDQSVNHLRVWNRTDGRLVSELRPLERKQGWIGQPVWSRDGKYLMASCPLYVGATPVVVAIWDVDAGRYRGALSSCQFPDAPATQLGLIGSRLLKTCGSDEALMWNVDDAIQKIEAFYRSLEIDH